MNTLKIKKTSVSKILNLVFSLIYGFFIVQIIQIDVENNSGDIGAYLKFFTEFSNLEYFLSSVDMQDNGFSFRYITIKLHNLFNIPYLNILKIYAFVISSIFFYIFFNKLNESHKVFYLSFLILMVFFTPRVWDLWASGIRSGIAFTLLFIALAYLHGISKYIVFLLSTLLHLSMFPIIGLYFIFNFLKYIKINNKKMILFFISIFYAISITLLAKGFLSIHPVAQSLSYQFLVLTLAFSFIFINKEVFEEQYGFLSICTILIVIFGFIFDVSFIRYIGYSIIFYLLFLLNKKNVRSIQMTSIFYIPFFLFTLFYSILNLI